MTSYAPPRVIVLVPLDFSSASDMVDHEIVLFVLKWRFVIACITLLNPTSKINGNSSAIHSVHCGVHRGSVLGPLEFISYTEDMTVVSKRHNNIKHHLLASLPTTIRRKQVPHCKVSSTCTVVWKTEAVANVRLVGQLNANKTEIA